jgi:hypothetical protein
MFKIFEYLRERKRPLKELIPLLKEILPEECEKLGINPELVIGIHPYRQCSTYARTANGKFRIKIYCGRDDDERYTFSKAKREMRHELRHIRDELDGKEPSELKATLYEIFGITF